MALAIALFLQDADALIRQLGDSDPARREAAFEALKGLAPASKEIDAKLEAAAAVGDVEVKVSAEALLRHRRLTRAVKDVDELTRLMGSAVEADRKRAVKLLLTAGEHGDPFLPDLIETLGYDVRQLVVNDIGRSRRKSAAPVIGAIAAGPEAPPEALRLLAELDSPRAREIALARIREAIEESDGKFAPQNLGVALDALQASGATGDDLKLVRALVENPSYSAYVVQSLLDWPEARRICAGYLSEAFESSPSPAAAAVLAEEGDVRHLEIFRKWMSPGWQGIGYAYALGRLKDKASVPLLLEAVKYYGRAGSDAMKNTYGTEVSAAAAWALGEIGDEDAVESLMSIWASRKGGQSEKKFSDKPHILAAVGRLGGAKVVREVLTALGEDDESVRAAAARALGDMGARGSVPALIGHLDDLIGYTAYSELPRDWLTTGRPTSMRVGMTVRESVIGALEKIAGTKFEGTAAEQAAEWKRWWAKAESAWK